MDFAGIEVNFFLSRLGLKCFLLCMYLAQHRNNYTLQMIHSRVFLFCSVTHKELQKISIYTLAVFSMKLSS